MNAPDFEQPPQVSEENTNAKSRPRWLFHLMWIGAYPIALGLLGLNRESDGGPALTRNIRGLLLTCGLQLLIFGAVFLLGWLASRASKEDLLLRWRPRRWVVLLGLGYSLALRLSVAVVAIFIFMVLLATRVVTPDQAQTFARNNQPDVTALVDMPAMRHDPLYFWLTITFVSFIVAGVREELWRSAVLAGMKRLWPSRFGSRAGQIFAVFIASLAFGLGHLSLGPMGVASATLLGFGLGAIMVLHQSIWPAVIAHGTFDATTFALLPWAMDQLHRT